MKILITADIHCGVPKRLNDCVWAMKTMRQYAADNSIDIVLILGDLFHDREYLNIEVINAVFEFLDETDRDFDQQWISFPGNHDMYLKNSWRINSLKPLSRLMTVIEKISLLKINDKRFWILPFIHYEQAYMNILDKIEEHYEEGDVLLTHIGINGASLNECFLLKHWNIVTFEDSKFDRIFTGHFHCNQDVGSVCYPGSPISFKYDEGLVDHGFIIYDIDSDEHEFIKIYDLANGYRPPDFLTINGGQVEDFEFVDGNNIRILPERDYTANEMMDIRSKLRDRGAVSVKFMELKEKEVDIEIDNLDKIDDLFDTWLEHDQPKGMNIDLLRKLNEQIVSEGDTKLKNIEE